MSIRDQLSKESLVKAQEVKYQGKTYIVQADPSADLQNTTFLAKPDRIAVLRKHWSVVPQVGRELDDMTIRQILLVHATLQPDPGETPYDVIEIAQLSITSGLLFLSLYAAAQECAGALDEVAAGNLEAPALGNQSKTAGASEEPVNPVQD